MGTKQSEFHDMVAIVADDHDSMRKAMRRVLNAMGIEQVLDFTDGADVLKVISSKPVDLIILDLYMKSTSGLDVLAQLRDRALSFDVPVILVTGESSRDDIVRAADLGATDYLLKPFVAEDLQKKVTKALQRSINPDPAQATILAAEKHYFNREFRQAIELFAKARQTMPESMRCRHGEALCQVGMGNDQQAITILRAALDDNPTYHKAFATLADIYERLNDLPNAIEAMGRELEINSKQPHRQVQLARILMKVGDIDGAIDHLREALKVSAKLKTGLMGMGHAFAKKNNLEKALYYFKRVRKHHRDSAKALEAVVKYAEEQNAGIRAEHFLKDDIKSHPNRFDAHLVLARYYFQTKRIDESFATLNDLLAKDANNIHGLVQLAKQYMEVSKFEEAAQTFTRAVAIHPSPALFNGLASAEISGNKLAEAIKTCTESITKFPNNVDGWLLLARATEVSGQLLKAHLIYQKAQALGATPSAVQPLLNQNLTALNNRRVQSRVA